MTGRAHWKLLIKDCYNQKQKCALSCCQNKNNLGLFISQVVLVVLICVDKLKYFPGFRSCRVFNEDTDFWTDPKTSNCLHDFHFLGFQPCVFWEGHWCSLLKQHQGTFVSNKATAKVLFSQRWHQRPSPVGCCYEPERETVRSSKAWELEVGMVRKNWESRQ